MDKFDDIWKNRFNEEEVSESDWLMPDDEVWNGIAPHVAPKKKQRSFFWFGLGMLIIFSLSVLILDKNNDSAQSLNQELTDNETPLVISKNKIDNNTITNPLTENSKTVLKKNTPSFIVEKRGNENIQNTISATAKLKEVVLLDTPKERTIKETVMEVPSLNMFLDEKSWTYSFEVSPQLTLEHLIPSDKRRITIGVWAGTTFWKHRISQQYTSHLSPIDFNYKDGLGWQTNLTMNIGLNKFIDAYLGFQYEQIKTTSGHNSNLTYSVLEEENPANPLNEYTLSLATPYGLSGTTFNFNRGNNIGTDEVDLLVDFHSSHLIKNLSFPVGAMIYPIGKNKKFVPNMTIGFGVNYLFQISNKIQSIETHHDAILYDDSGTATFISPDLDKWDFDYRLGLGLRYELNRNLHFQLNYAWSRGINPIFKFGNYNTRIDRHHISFGLAKTL